MSVTRSYERKELCHCGFGWVRVLALHGIVFTHFITCPFRLFMDGLFCINRRIAEVCNDTNTGIYVANMMWHANHKWQDYKYECSAGQPGPAPFPMGKLSIQIYYITYTDKILLILCMIMCLNTWCS